jgi:hypothetical protein
MKRIELVLRSAVCSAYCSDHDVADAAYAAIKKAMNEYRFLSNDNSKTVTFAFTSGEQTLLVAEIYSVSIIDLAISEKDCIERAVWEKSIEAKVAARLAPPPSATAG